MDENILNSDNCSEFTIYTEDFCMCFGSCKPGCYCAGCDGFNKLWEWLSDKSPDKKSFFEV